MFNMLKCNLTWLNVENHNLRSQQSEDSLGYKFEDLSIEIIEI